jgi:hypothetical protein
MVGAFKNLNVGQGLRHFGNLKCDSILNDKCTPIRRGGLGSNLRQITFSTIVFVLLNYDS